MGVHDRRKKDENQAMKNQQGVPKKTSCCQFNIMQLLALGMALMYFSLLRQTA